MSVPSKARPPKPRRKTTAPLLFHADSADPDFLYFSRFRTSDPIVALEMDGRKIGLAVPMEFARMKEESAFDEVLPLDKLREETTKRFKLNNGRMPDDSLVIRHLAKTHGIRRFRVGSRFPAGLAFQLEKAGIKISVEENGGLLPQREFKTSDEIKALREGNRAAAAGHRAVARTLKESTIRGGRVVHKGVTLTSERLHEIIGRATFEAGAVSFDIIAASGDQACDCHNAGSGPIRAGELIVVDIFPRRLADGYWGDMTRTFLKGRASDAQRKLVRTVRRGLDLGIKMVRPGIRSGTVHDAVAKFFEDEGYATNRSSDNPKGFFHALGHGVGLEVHEKPAMRSKAKDMLREGMVVTVEPGLYYRGLGGVRFEDVVHVTDGGSEKISSAPYKWEIP